MDTSDMIIYRLNDVSDGIVKNFNDASDGIVKRFNDASDGLYKLINDVSIRHDADNTLMQQYINTQIGSVNDSITGIDQKYESKFKTLYEDDIKDINSSITNIRKKYAKADWDSSTDIYNYLKNQYKKEITGEIGEVDKKISDYIKNNDSSITKLDNKINSVNTNLGSWIDASFGEVSGYIYDVSTRLVNSTNALSGKITTVDNRITTEVNKLTESIQSHYDTLDGRITSVQDTLLEKISGNYTTLNDRITSVKDGIYKDLNNYDSSLEGYTNAEIKALRSELGTVNSNLSQRITNDKANVDSSITRIDNYLKYGYWTSIKEYVDGSIGLINTSINKVKSELENKLTNDYISKTYLTNYYNDTIKTYIDKQDVLYNTSVNDISTRLNTANTNIQHLNDKLVALTSDNIDGTINTYKEVQDFLNNISDTTTLVSLLANAKTEAIDKAKQYTDNSINNFKTTYVKPKFDSYDNSISTINGDIKNINGKITTNQNNITNLNSSVNDISTKITNISGTISTINSNINDLKAFKDTVNNKNYLTEIPIANDTKLGGIKTGYTPTGANANRQLPVTLNTAGAAYVTLTNTAVMGAYTYTLPTATQASLGGIKTGYTNNGNKVKVEVDNSGNAFVALTETAVKGGYTYTLPTAGATTLGGICTGYTNSGSNVKVQMSGNNAYVGITKDAIVSALQYTPAKGNSDGSNTYTLPKATGSTLGGIQIGYNQNNTTTTLNIPVKLDANGNAYISINIADLQNIGAITTNNITSNITQVMSNDSAWLTKTQYDAVQNKGSKTYYIYE